MEFLKIFDIGLIYIEILNNLSLNNILNLKHVSKETNEIIMNYGFLKSVKIDFRTNLYKFIDMFNKHYYTIETITIDRIKDPHLWMPNMVKNLKINFCEISYLDLPNSLENLENLELVNCNYNNPEECKIAWHKLTNLKSLFIKSSCIDLSGIKNCKKLEKVIIFEPYVLYDNIHTKNKKDISHIIDEITSLPNLRVLILTEKINGTQVIRSPNLEILLIFGNHITVKSKKIQYICNGKWELGKPPHTDPLINDSINLYRYVTFDKVTKLKKFERKNYMEYSVVEIK